MDLRLAVTARARLTGLLGSRAPSTPLLLAPAACVHTCGMSRPIDVVFLDAELRVVRVVRRLRPWRVVRARGAVAALELEGGTARAAVGQRLRLSA